MPIKSLSKLPVRARNMWESVYKELKGKYGEEKAAMLAWGVVKKKYKSVRTGKKSLVVSQNNAPTTEHSIDVILGYDMGVPDAHNEILTEKFWLQKPLGVLKGDMEHYYADKAEGLYIDDSEDFEGWVPVAQKFWHDNGKLMARVELPENHPFTPTFLNNWKSGEYGLSVEFIYPEEAVEYKVINDNLIPHISEGSLTGFTFTKNPASKIKQNGNIE